VTLMGVKPRGLAVYPTVHDEFKILDAILVGQSLSRFGDGECKMLMGVGHKYENYDPRCQRILRDVIAKPRRGLIVGVPRLVPECPRALWWEPWKWRMQPYMHPDMEYWSSFISRPDHAPWIEADKKFRTDLDLIWRGKTVVLVGSGKSLTKDRLEMGGAEVLEFIQTPLFNAFPMIDDIMRTIKARKPHIAILCAGMLATCVPYLLAGEGIQCLDLGAIGQQKLWDTARKINAGEIKE
jgi:glycosyltransferase GT-like protein